MSHELTRTALATQLSERYGLLLTQSQLAEFLGRTPAGLRWSLAHPIDVRTEAIRDCSRRIGRRLYYPVTEVAAIVARASK